jgi:pyridoxal phosphate enzyme (YggS family)
MSEFAEKFARGLAEVQGKIISACQAAGRSPAEVRLLPVTKNHPVEAVALSVAAGLESVGENRVQETATKRAQAEAAGIGVRWEMIGHLQSNKAKLAVRLFDRIQSVDSIRLLDLLDREATQSGRVLPVLLQINAGADPAKSGAEIGDAQGLFAHALTKTALRVDGLMTIAPHTEESADARRTFAALRQIRDELVRQTGHPLPDLSMGMTGDIMEAIAEGSTIVRVGTALFGQRPIPD